MPFIPVASGMEALSRRMGAGAVSRQVLESNSSRECVDYMCNVDFARDYVDNSMLICRSGYVEDKFKGEHARNKNHPPNSSDP